MNDFGRERKAIGPSRYTENPFGKMLPDLMPTDDLPFLVGLHRAKLLGKKEKELILIHHVRLAVNIVRQSAWRAKHLINDLVQVSLLSAIVAINEAPDKLIDNNITPYLTTKIRSAIHEAIDKDGLVPGRTKRHSKAKYQGRFIPEYCTFDLEHDLAGRDETQMVEVLDMIQACILKDENLKRREYKKVVVRLRASGYTNEEIADIIEISKDYVTKLLRSVKEEFGMLLKQS